MNQSMEHNQMKNCPQCGNHCPVDALQCGKGRKYFGTADKEHGGHDHEHDHGGHSRSKLAKLLHKCGRFVHHTELEEAELFQALTDEEKASLQAMLGKLAASWQERYGKDGFRHGGGKHHHKHEGRGK